MDGFILVQEMLAVICVLMSAVLVYNTLTNLITQQTNQIGILKAIGGTSATIIGVYLVSAFVYGLLALDHCAAPGRHCRLWRDTLLPGSVQH